MNSHPWGGSFWLNKGGTMLVAELKLKVGPLSLPLWRTTEPHVVGFLRLNMRRRLLSAAMDRRKPKPIREWASAKLRELDRMEDMAEARGDEP